MLDALLQHSASSWGRFLIAGPWSGSRWAWEARAGMAGGGAGAEKVQGSCLLYRLPGLAEIQARPKGSFSGTETSYRASLRVQLSYPPSHLRPHCWTPCSAVINSPPSLSQRRHEDLTSRKFNLETNAILRAGALCWGWCLGNVNSLNCIFKSRSQGRMLTSGLWPVLAMTPSLWPWVLYSPVSWEAV